MKNSSIHPGLRTVLLCVLLLLPPAGARAYRPPAAAILFRVTSVLSGAGSGEIRLNTLDRDGEVLEEKLVEVPYQEPDKDPLVVEGVPYRLPYYFFTLPPERYPAILQTLSSEGTATSYTRIGRDVCFLLDSGPARLWVRKSDAIPLRAELKEADGSVTRYEYLDPSPTGGKLLYPLRTVVTNRDTIVFTEAVVFPETSIEP